MKDFWKSGDSETRHINRWLAENCFGDYYTRKGLDLKQREMITFCFILAQGGCENQLTAHIQGNLNVGNDKEFLLKVLTQCLPYIGYPRSLNALACIKKVCDKEDFLMKDVLLLVGAGQIGMAIARRIGFDKKIIIGDKNLDNAKKIADIMYNAGFDVNYLEVDLADRISIKNYIQEAQKYGQIGMLINAAGVSPSQASIETILKVDLYGTAVLLEEVGKVIKPYGTGVTISSQSGHRMEALGSEIDEQLATTDCEDLLSLPVLQAENIKDNLHAYQLAKRCNVKRVMAEAVKWGKKKARINSISPGIIVTPLAIDEFNGKRGAFYKNMFAKAPAGRPGTADEVANVAELLMSEKGSFITGADFLVDGGATAAYFYGDLNK